MDKTVLTNKIFYILDSYNPIWTERLMAGLRSVFRSVRGYSLIEITPMRNLSLKGRPNSHSEIHYLPYPSDLGAIEEHQPVEKVTHIF